MEFELIDPLLHADDVLLDPGLLCLESCDLVLQTGSFSPLILIVPLDLLLNAVQFISKRLASIALLHGQHRLQCLLLRAENLYLFLVGAELFLKATDRLIEAAQFALQVRCVGVGAVRRREEPALSARAASRGAERQGREAGTLVGIGPACLVVEGLAVARYGKRVNKFAKKRETSYL